MRFTSLKKTTQNNHISSFNRKHTLCSPIFSQYGAFVVLFFSHIQKLPLGYSHSFLAAPQREDLVTPVSATTASADTHAAVSFQTHGLEKAAAWTWSWTLTVFESSLPGGRQREPQWSPCRHCDASGSGGVDCCHSSHVATSTWVCIDQWLLTDTKPNCPVWSWHLLSIGIRQKQGDLSMWVVTLFPMFTRRIY